MERICTSFIPVGLAMLVLCSACTESASSMPPGENAAEGSTVTGEGEALQELAGTSWQLVEIQSMDDTSYVPEDGSLFTLDFGADGSVSMRIDCNRGNGSWTSDSPGQIEFGTIAATKALCPPDSLHDIYLRQFEWVRSYVFRDGHLFLATMADGSIIEFEPID